MTRLLATAAAAAIVLVTTLGVTVGTASAANEGCGGTCTGKDPQTWAIYDPGPTHGNPITCGDSGKTVHKKNGLELRASDVCRTAWARFSGGWCVGCSYYFQIERNDSKKLPNAFGNNVYRWTPMVNNKNMESRACLYSRWSAEEDFTKAFCTDWY